jgi:hypothetical protein
MSAIGKPTAVEYSPALGLPAKVAGSRAHGVPTLSSLQPRRTPVVVRVAAILDDAPSHATSGLPLGYSHRDLACEAYGVDEPTAAQLSAVRRAVAQLVAQGRATRARDRMNMGVGRHLRRSRSQPNLRYQYANPTGVTVRRSLTDADREARAAVVARMGPTWTALTTCPG